MQDPEIAVQIYALRGEIEAAVDVALERIFNESVATSLDWRQWAVLPQFADVLADPRVQAAMQRWEAEEQDLREGVRSFLEDLQAAS